MVSSSSGAAAPIDVDPLVLPDNQQSSLFPVAANVTTDTVPLCLFLDKHGGGSPKGDGEEDAFFVMQVHQQQGDAQEKESRVWTATIPAGETAGKMATLAELLRRPEAITTLEVVSSSSTEVEGKEAAAAATLSIKQVVEKGKKVLLKPTVLRATDAPVRSLAMALSRTATQLAHVQRALLAAERQNSLYQEEHGKMQGLLLMEVAKKDRVQEELMFKFNLLLNTKRAKIVELLQRLGEKERGVEEEMEVTDEEEEVGGQVEEEEEKGQGGGAGGGRGCWKGAKAKLPALRKPLSDVGEEAGDEEEEEENSHKKTQTKRKKLPAAAASGTRRGSSKSNCCRLALPSKKKVKVEGGGEEGRERGRGGLLSAVKGTKEVLGGIDALLRETKNKASSSSSIEKKQQQQQQLTTKKKKKKKEKRGLDSSSSDYGDDSSSSGGGGGIVTYSAKGQSEEGGAASTLAARSHSPPGPVTRYKAQVDHFYLTL
eukprot:evm.model.NODE_9949_length_46820_cov_28.931910.7